MTASFITRSATMRPRALWSSALGCILVASAVLLAGCGGGHRQATQPAIAALSANSGVVTGGDVLVQVSVPAGTAPADVAVTLNQQDVTQQLKTDADGNHLVGVLSGLTNGQNVIGASIKGQAAPGANSATVQNYSSNGPVISGPQQAPFLCETQAFGLGAPLDANCNATTKVSYFYFAADNTFKPFDPAAARPADLMQTTTSEGTTVDYIVRLETGTLDRAVYQIAFLHQPGTHLPDPWTSTPGWNKRLAYTFGGGCSAGFHQGRATGGVLELLGPGTGSILLARGYAVASSSLNVWGNNCNDLITAEAAMMVKEYFVEHFGVPRWTMGFGGSGGSMQQHLIAQNYPGILDGILAMSSFPDIFTIIPPAVDCKLLKNAFDGSTQPWSTDQKSAVAGFAGWSNCVQGTGAITAMAPGSLSWMNIGFSPGWIVAAGSAGGACDPLIPANWIYDPVANPKGVRCTIQDNNANGLGVDPVTGFARRPYDNVGVQYGLAAFNAGQISAEQFVDLNERIGGFDIDGNVVASRSAADVQTLQNAYSLGRINTGGGGLASIPIVDVRRYQDTAPDIHDRVRSLSTRQRLIAANGNADNHVILTTNAIASPSLANSPFQALTWTAVVQLERWMDAIRADGSGATAARKAAANRPGDLVDACYTPSGQKIAEPASATGSGQCNQLYPVHGDPRMAAGAPLSGDVIKCQLKPIAASDYSQPLTDPQLARLRAVFPDGVCDYSKPGVGQQKVKDTWLRYTQPGVAMRIDQ